MTQLLVRLRHDNTVSKWQMVELDDAINSIQSTQIHPFNESHVPATFLAIEYLTVEDKNG